MGEDRPTSRVDDAVVAPDNDLSDLVVGGVLSGLCDSDEQGLFFADCLEQTVGT